MNKVKKMYLTFIEWSSKEVAGEILSAYAYVENPTTTINFPMGQSGSYRATKSKDDELPPIWLKNFTPEMFEIFKEQGYETILFNPTTKEHTYCGTNYSPDDSDVSTSQQPIA